MTTTELNSIGHLCQIFQRSYSDVAAAIAALELKPAAILNGVPHFSAAAVDAIATHLRMDPAQDIRGDQPLGSA